MTRIVRTDCDVCGAEITSLRPAKERVSAVDGTLAITVSFAAPEGENANGDTLPAKPDVCADCTTAVQHAVVASLNKRREKKPVPA